VSVTVRVPAKLNLQLQVRPPRPDGFHDLHTVFQAVSLYDTVTASAGDGLSITVSGAAHGVPADSTNLAWRAAALLAATCGVRADAELLVHKAIPVAGGMAGGSADAAAALVACARLWGVSADLPSLAASLGSDVAFPLLGTTAVGTGRGEVLSAVPSAALHWVFAFADFGIAAGDAYRELDRMRESGAAPPSAGSLEALVDALPEGDVDAIGALLENDLEPAVLALAPSLAETLAAGRAAGAVAGIVSGSGPTCAFLCRSATHASAVAAALGDRAAVAHGPVPGATVTG
jgi:4-diphosphocytidyl-2-C-methyl-D-erythritol kinase